jgi:hypothetical protein
MSKLRAPVGITLRVNLGSAASMTCLLLKQWTQNGAKDHVAIWKYDSEGGEGGGRSSG